jgi:hypothetical protein
LIENNLNLHYKEGRSRKKAIFAKFLIQNNRNNKLNVNSWKNNKVEWIFDTKYKEKEFQFWFSNDKQNFSEFLIESKCHLIQYLNDSEIEVCSNNPFQLSFGKIVSIEKLHQMHKNFLK